MELLPLGATAVASLTNAELEGRLLGLKAIERKTTTILLAHLGEFDRRRLYADRSQPSLFQYCVKVLGYSEQAAYKRIQAARAAREHPVLLERLWHGDLNLAAIVILAPHLRKDNLGALLEKARGKSKNELESFAADLAPRPDCLDLVRAMPLAPARDDVAGSPQIEPERSFTTPSAGPREKVEPLSAERFLFRFTGSVEFRAKYSRARSLLREENARKMERVFESALDALLDQLDPERRQRRREARQQRSRKPLSSSRILPQALRDEIWNRDGGRCTFVDSEGARCAAAERLEIDHVRPYSLGGLSDTANLRLLCRAHNLLMARRVFGRDYPRG